MQGFVQCPRCNGTVAAPAFGSPVCQACGFGAPASPAMQGYAAARPQKTSGMAISGFVLSLVTLLLGWIPVVGLVTLITWPLGLIFSIVGLVQVNRSNGAFGGKGLAITGLVLSLVGLVMMFVVIAAVVFVLVSDLGAEEGAAAARSAGLLLIGR